MKSIKIKIKGYYKNYIGILIILVIGFLLFSSCINLDISVIKAQNPSDSSRNYPPSLFNGTVTPMTGNTSTMFTYQVEFSDPENKSPVEAYVFIDSRPYNMIFISGNNLTGALYQLKMRLPPANHSFYYMFSDGNASARDPATTNYWGPNVSVIGGGNNRLVLSNGTVSPYSGSANTLFTYQITYKDPDNAVPIDKIVYISYYPHTMTYVSGDNATGAIYQFQTYLDMGNYYNYFFYFTNINDTEIYPYQGYFWGPYVHWPSGNHTPILSNGSVMPRYGNTSTIFTYQVTYSDADNDTPVTKIVCIDGKSYTMSYVSGNNTAGAIYQYKTKLNVGNHTYYFLFGDITQRSVRLPSYWAYYGPVVTSNGSEGGNNPPILDGYVTPSSGTTSTVFTYIAFYYDLDNDTPTVMKVYIDGKSHNLTYVSGNNTHGAKYQYKTTLGLGKHNYYFVFSDGNATVRLPSNGTMCGPYVSSSGGCDNTPPRLYYGHVYPLTGTPNTIFTYTVYYFDSDNDTPVIKYVYIDGKPYTMNYVTGSNKHGATYQYKTPLSLGNHTYYFYFTDGNASARDPSITWGNYSGPTVRTTGPPPPNNPPILSCGSVSPQIGTNATLFTYKVKYKDLDHDLPTIRYVCIDGVQFNMSYQHGSITYGAMYQFQTTLTDGNHTYYFSFSDGNASVRLPTAGTFKGPNVNSSNNSYNNPPLLTYAFVTPRVGDTNTIFTYYVIYTDLENDKPTINEVYINNIPNTMSYTNGNYNKGAVYQYKTKLPAGYHKFFYKFSDGISITRLPISGNYSGPYVKYIPPPNNPPVLYRGSVSPTTGTTRTIFTYQVFYKDADGDSPTISKLYIDYKGYTMKFVQGSNSTGAFYQFKTTLNVGPHNYYFLFSDGEARVRLPVRCVYCGPKVTCPPNHPPVADAGPDQTITVGPKKIVYFDGSGSYDPDNDTLIYYWDFNDGCCAFGINVSHRFKGVGTYKVKLTVWDGRASDSDYCLIHVKDSGKGKSKGKAPDKNAPGFEGLMGIIALGGCTLFYLYRRRRVV